MTMARKSDLGKVLKITELQRQNVHKAIMDGLRQRRLIHELLRSGARVTYNSGVK